jgi:hypothetical protein
MIDLYTRIMIHNDKLIKPVNTMILYFRKV